MATINFKALSGELLKAIRKTKSQEFISRKFNKKFNQVVRWENGYRKISWNDFIKFCEICKIDIKKILWQEIYYDKDILKFNEIVKSLQGNEETAIFSRTCNFPLSKIRRIIRQESKPTLEDFLQLLFYSKNSVFHDLINKIAKLENIPSLNNDYANMTVQKNLIWSYPVTAAIRACLELDEYKKFKKHVHGYISKNVGISLNEEKEILSLMIKANLIELRNNKLINIAGNVDTRGSLQGSINLRLFWTNKILTFLNNLKTPPQKSAIANYVFAIAEDENKKILIEYENFLKKILKILEKQNHKPKTSIKILNVQLLDLKEFSEITSS